MTVIRLPSRSCNHEALIEAIHRSGARDAENLEIKVQLQPNTFLSTAALALLCAWGLLRRKHGCTFGFIDPPERLSYPARMDLFRHLDVDYRESFTRHDEKGRFLPLKLITDRGPAVRDVVEAVRDLVALQFDGADSFLPALRWVVQELTDNIGNHAESPVAGVICAQFYPGKRLVELAVCDMGLGLKATLEPRYPKVWSHGDAISKAL